MKLLSSLFVMLWLTLSFNAAAQNNISMPIDIIFLRYFNGMVGGDITHPMGLRVGVQRDKVTVRRVYEATLSGDPPSYYFVREFTWLITVQNVGQHDIAIYDWNFKAICPLDNMGREYDATSYVNVVTPYIPGDIYIVLKPGERKRFFSGKTDFFWCLPNDKKALEKGLDKYFQALITCAAILPKTAPPGGPKKRGNFNPPPGPTPLKTTGGSGGQRPPGTKPPLDPEVIKLIKEYNAEATAGNSERATQLKAILLDLIRHVFPGRMAEVTALLKPVKGRSPVQEAPSSKTGPGGGGMKKALLFSDWYFMQSDKAIQYQLALVRQVRDTGYLRMRLRINKEDGIWCRQETCLGYLVFLGYDMPDMATSRQHHFMVFNSYNKPYYEMPFDIPVLLKTYPDGSRRYWDTELRKVMYHIPSSGEKGMANFLSVCVDDIINNYPQHRCRSFDEASAILVK